MPPEQVSRICGVLKDDGRPAGDGGLRFSLHAERVGDRYGNQALASGTVTITCTGKIAQGRSGDSFSRGCRIQCPVELHRIYPCSNVWFGHVKGELEYVSGPGGVMRVRRSVNGYIRNSLRRTGGAAAPLMEALLLGYKDFRSDSIVSLFRKSGTVHLLALSGMHMGLISLAVLSLLIPVLGKTKSLWLNFILLCGYLYLAGPRASLLRAFMMYGIGVSGFTLLNIRIRVFHLLVMSFFIHALCFPLALMDLGFQLSYAALAGILLFTDIFDRLLPCWIPPFIRKPLAANLSAVLCTSWLIVKHFGVLYPAGIIGSIVLTPLVALWMCTGTAYLIFSLFGVLLQGSLFLRADVLFRGLIGHFAHFTMETAAFFSRLPVLPVPQARWLLIAGIVCAVLTLAVLSQYADTYGAAQKLQLTEGDRPGARGQWNGPCPPVWSEFPHLPGREGENHRAA